MFLSMSGSLISILTKLLSTHLQQINAQTHSLSVSQIIKNWSIMNSQMMSQLKKIKIPIKSVKQKLIEFFQPRNRKHLSSLMKTLIRKFLTIRSRCKKCYLSRIKDSITIHNLLQLIADLLQGGLAARTQKSSQDKHPSLPQCFSRILKRKIQTLMPLGKELIRSDPKLD